MRGHAYDSFQMFDVSIREIGLLFCGLLSLCSAKESQLREGKGQDQSVVVEEDHYKFGISREVLDTEIIQANKCRDKLAELLPVTVAGIDGL